MAIIPSLSSLELTHVKALNPLVWNRTTDKFS